MKCKLICAILICIVSLLCFNIIIGNQNNNTLSFIIVDAGMPMNVTNIEHPVKLNGKVEWFLPLKVKLYVVRGYILRLDFLDNPLWKNNNFYHLRMTEDFVKWTWVIRNKQIDPSKPYITYPETIKQQQFFQVYVSNTEIDLNQF